MGQGFKEKIIIEVERKPSGKLTEEYISGLYLFKILGVGEFVLNDTEMDNLEHAIRSIMALGFLREVVYELGMKGDR